MTPNLILRDMCLEDEAAFVALSQDDKYQRFYEPADCTPEKYRELTQLFIEQAQAKPRMAYQLAIEYEKQFIGVACLRMEAHRQASIGGGLAPAYQGRGTMKTAMQALIDFGFSRLNIHRIYAETISQNQPAVRLCQQLGMRQEAYFKAHRYFKNQWWDTVVMALLKTEWTTQSDFGCLPASTLVR